MIHTLSGTTDRSSCSQQHVTHLTLVKTLEFSCPCWVDAAQQAPDVYVTSGWRWTWRQTDVAFWLKMKIGLTSIFDFNLTLTYVGFWLHNLKTTKSQRQLTSVLDINLTLTLDVGFTLNFGHLTSQPKFNQISTSYDVVCLLCDIFTYKNKGQ